MATPNLCIRAGLARRDVLVVILLFVIVIGLIFVAMDFMRDRAAHHATMNNLAQNAKGVHLCQEQFNKLPPYFGPYGAKTTSSTFHVNVMPFVGQNPLFSNPIPFAGVPSYVSPMDPTQTEKDGNACSFPVNMRLFYTEGGLGELAGPGNLIYPNLNKSFPDGLENTLLFATKYVHCGAKGGSLWDDPGKNAADSLTAATFGASMALWQRAPSQDDCDPSAGTAVSFVRGSIQVALCDASVRTVSSGISPATWQALHTPGGNDKLGVDWQE